jgi:hypothetical protein
MSRIEPLEKPRSGRVDRAQPLDLLPEVRHLPATLGQVAKVDEMLHSGLVVELLGQFDDPRN